MLKQNNWYVITGAPHSGKTTLINLLNNLGYKTRDETARLFIDREMAKGKTLEEIRGDELGFQREVLQMKIITEKEADCEEVIFWDRGIPDSDAYYELISSKLEEALIIEEEFVEAIKNSKYKKVFLLDYYPYSKDYARIESEEEQIKLHSLLEDSYRKLKAEIIKVPVMNSDEERLNFILNNL